MALSDTAIRNAKPKAKPWKLADAKGLYLLITPGGSKLWRVKYRFLGKEKKLSFGAYPEISLSEPAGAKLLDACAHLRAAYSCMRLPRPVPTAIPRNCLRALLRHRLRNIIRG